MLRTWSKLYVGYSAVVHPEFLHGMCKCSVLARMQVEWKLKRGSWRPKLLDYAKSISPKEIKEASKQAFLKASKASQGDDTAYREAVKEALNILTKLKVCSPHLVSSATARSQFRPFKDHHSNS